MKKKIVTIIIYSLAYFILLSGCKPEEKNTFTFDQNKKEIMELEKPSGVIFSKQSLEYYPSFPQGKSLWSATKEDAQKADSITEACIDNKEKTIETMLKNYFNDNEERKKQMTSYYNQKFKNIKTRYPDYYRQYLGYIDEETSHKLIWINFFIPDEYLLKDWKNSIIAVNDGGDYFFNVLVDIEDNKCLNFSINGEA